MNKYERLEYVVPDVKIKKMVMPYGLKGLYYTNNIVIDKSLSYYQSIEVLAEEIGHHFTSLGDIRDYNNISSMKQETKARRYGYELVVSLDDLIDAYQNDVRTMCELTHFLEVTPEFISKAIDYYKSKYGLSTVYKNYKITFDPFSIVDIRH
ncbi:ImmA/IrrE family metallo-endopeptidase [Macrococcus animalis]|uniref:ImmA/IrrE family metallo-endopeptidase n=1 Tax=Macrococcus animalis TaxID=3395467 RepID=UPI0039BE73B1